jgi:OOP family OmpA-OmpF porin
MRYLLVLLCLPFLFAADVPDSKDPAGMKRYEGSEIIGYHAPKFDEYILPLSTPQGVEPPTFKKSLPVEGLISRHTYIAPAGRTATELMRNYKLEFQRLGIETMFEKKAGEPGWFGPGYNKAAEEDGLSQILAYNEADERLIVGKSKDAKPTYYVVFVTSYRDGVIPERLTSVVEKGRALAVVTVIAPEAMEQKMAFVNAGEMKGAIGETGKVVLYGIFFDTDKDVVKPESKPTLDEISKLMKSNPSLKIHVVGHSDNQGKPDYNLDLSRRRAASVVRELTSKYAITADRLDSFGCGLYSPLASNTTEEGRAKNRRVELVQ